MKIKIGNFDCTECWDGVFYKKLSAFPKITERLILRRWTEADTESLEVIRNVFCGSECYAVCKKEGNKAIGAVELKLNGYTDMNIVRILDRRPEDIP